MRRRARTRVAALLPAHWQTAAVLLAAWWCGAEVVADPLDADWVLCDGDRRRPRAGRRTAGGVLALSLDAFGKGLPGLPAGVVDFATEVRLQGDEFVPWAPVPDHAPALAGATVAEVLAAARDRAAALRLGAGRPGAVHPGLGQTRRADRRAARGAGRRGVAGAVPQPDPAALARRAAAERTTVRLG